MLAATLAVANVMAASSMEYDPFAAEGVTVAEAEVVHRSILHRRCPLAEAEVVQRSILHRRCPLLNRRCLMLLPETTIC
jgi:hypothetical protein